jgi:hypothetical protein
MSSPPSTRVRFTIAVDPEVYEAFADLAHTSGVSLSRCIGDWLRDTSEAAQMTTLKMQEVRRSPQDAFEAFMRDGIVPEVQRLLSRSQERLGPPSSNTGGKSTTSQPADRPKKSAR